MLRQSSRRPDGVLWPLVSFSRYSEGMTIAESL